MGTWTLIGSTADIRPRDDVFGNFFAVTFRLKYQPSTFGGFTEMPRLQWKETITMVEERKREWWQHIVDQYERDPNSQTFFTWTHRYTLAHYAVRQQKYGPDDTVKLFSLNQQQLPAATFGRAANPKEEADQVRSYLKSKGGIMHLTVVDKPGINRPDASDTAFHKHRILTFDCGIGPGGTRIKAYQQLIVDGAKPPAEWRRQCEVSSFSTPFSTAGMTRVQPPADVMMVKAFTGGAHDGTYL
jgi:hypothetical protein